MKFRMALGLTSRARHLAHAAEPNCGRKSGADMSRTVVAMAPLLVAGQAVGQETITLNGVVRTVSLTTAIYGCGRYYPINTRLIERVALASRRMDEEVAAREGKDWRAVLVAELERRITEVNATGQQLWCQYQYEIPGNRPPLQTERLSAAWLSQT
jgi:hypothetical protein